MSNILTFLIFPLILFNSFLFSEVYFLPKGLDFAEIKCLYYQTHHFWNREGKRQETYSDFKRNEIEIKNSFGLTNSDTIGFKSAYDGIQEYLDGNTYGITDLEINWNHCFFHTNNLLIGSKVIGIIPPQLGYKPSLRYGQFGGEISIVLNQVIQTSHRKYLIYGDLGYRWYNGFPSDQIRNKLGFFHPLNLKFSIQIESEIIYGLFNGKSQLNQSLVWMNPNFRLWKGEFQGNYRISNRFLVGISCFQFFAGRNVGTSGGFTTKFNLVF